MSSACSTRRDRWLVFLVMLVMLALVACLAPPEAEEDAGTAAVAFAGSGSGSGSTDPLPEPIVDAGVDDARMDDASLSPDAGCVAQPEPTCATPQARGCRSGNCCSTRSITASSSSWMSGRQRLMWTPATDGASRAGR